MSASFKRNYSKSVLQTRISPLSLQSIYYYNSSKINKRPLLGSLNSWTLSVPETSKTEEHREDEKRINSIHTYSRIAEHISLTYFSVYSLASRSCSVMGRNPRCNSNSQRLSTDQYLFTRVSHIR